jgi:hypothetical protein
LHTTCTHFIFQKFLECPNQFFGQGFRSNRPSNSHAKGGALRAHVRAKLFGQARGHCPRLGGIAENVKGCNHISVYLDITI